MSISFLSPNRTVLLVSDEGLHIYIVNAKTVSLVETLPWDIENFLQTVVSLIAKECGRRPILILNDMVEQHFRKEKIVKTGVGQLDKANIVKRKLNVAFPNYPLRAAYELKEKIKKTANQAPADVYIFAAVPNTTQFESTVNVSKKSLNSLDGFCLLPVESSNMVSALSAKLSKGKPPVWSVFIGQHRSGGLRQIVTKDGGLALTRMTPVIDTDKDPQQWAQEVHKEFMATMSYLSRFGYTPNQGLNAIAIANVEGGDILQSMIGDDIHMHAMTVSEAAKLINIPIGPQQEQHHADPLHVAWAGRKSRFILPMKASQVDAVSRPRQVALAASLAMFAGAAFLGYQFVTEQQILSQTKVETEIAEKRKEQLDVQYAREVLRKEELGFDVRLVQSSIDVHEQFERERINTIALFKDVGKALGRDFKLSDVSVKRFKENVANRILGNRFSNNESEDKKLPVFISTLQMTYPSTTDIAKGNQEVEALRNRMEEALPLHDVSVTKLLKDYGFEEGIIVEAGDFGKKDVTQDFVAEITIKGPPVLQRKEGGR